MSLDYVKFSSGFEKFMPKEYRDMVEHGPFGKKVSVSQMGSFKEVLEEHPMCAGCAMTLFIRLAMIAFPNPEDTITVGTAGCGRCWWCLKAAAGATGGSSSRMTGPKRPSRPFGSSAALSAVAPPSWSMRGTPGSKAASWRARSRTDRATTFAR